MILKATKYIFTVLFAAYFLLAGVGYNVVNYCCNSCADEGIEAISASSCHAVHEQKEEQCCNQQHEDIACNDVHHLPLSCHLLRLQIDTPSIATVLISSPIVCFDLFYSLENILITKPLLALNCIIQPPQKPFPPSGRELLALNAVFLI